MSSAPESLPLSPRLLTDPITGEQVLCAPGRTARPRRVRAQWLMDDKPCHFCEGNEHQTPLEVDAVRATGAVNGPGWTVRVVHNLYPAVLPIASTDDGLKGVHEVLIEGAAHTRHPAELPADVLRLSFEVAGRRIAAIGALPGIRAVFLFKNVGPQAGASMEHNHMQILGVPIVPPRILRESSGALAYRQRQGRCAWCDIVADAARDGRVVWEQDGLVALAPPAPRFPYETWILPLRHAVEFPRDRATLWALGDLYGRLARALHAFAELLPFNLWLHAQRDHVPEPLHWHLEIVPRHGAHAGFEIGGELPINSVPPQDAAKRLRVLGG